MATCYEHLTGAEASLDVWGGEHASKRDVHTYNSLITGFLTAGTIQNRVSEFRSAETPNKTCSQATHTDQITVFRVSPVVTCRCQHKHQIPFCSSAEGGE